MKIKEFIKKLERISKEHGSSLEIKMADGIPVASPVYVKNHFAEYEVVITDEE